jgi:hypothetical protein
MAPGGAWVSVFDAWGELATGATGEDASVEVSRLPRFDLPNRPIRDPYGRWCGEGEAVRLMLLPIRCPSISSLAKTTRKQYNEPQSFFSPVTQEDAHDCSKT